MSEAKVLTEKQKRASLSNAKKKKKPVLKNVYVHPHDEYWPALSAEDENIVTDLMKRLFPAVRRNKVSKQEHKTQPEVRKRKRNSSCQEESSDSLEAVNIRSQLVIGLREVIAAIEHDELKCLLLAKEVDPPFLRHIVGNLAAASNVPCVTITNFREVLEEVHGFKSWCVGFKDLPNGHFTPLCDKVLSFIKEPRNSGFSAGLPSTSECAHSSSRGNKQLPKPSSLADLHLYRTDKSKRVFVPGLSANSEETSASFLQFSRDDSDNEMGVLYPQRLSNTKPSSSSATSKQTQPQRYFDKIKLLPVQVKKFQGNPNKAKWRKDFRNKPK